MVVQGFEALLVFAIASARWPECYAAAVPVIYEAPQHQDEPLEQDACIQLDWKISSLYSQVHLEI